MPTVVILAWPAIHTPTASLDLHHLISFILVFVEQIVLISFWEVAEKSSSSMLYL